MKASSGHGAPRSYRVGGSMPVAARRRTNSPQGELNDHTMHWPNVKAQMTRTGATSYSLPLTELTFPALLSTVCTWWRRIAVTLLLEP
jgi:hypothetical protein